MSQAPTKRCRADGTCVTVNPDGTETLIAPDPIAPPRPTQGGPVNATFDASGAATPVGSIKEQTSPSTGGSSGGARGGYDYGGGGYSHRSYTPRDYNDANSSGPKFADGSYPGQSRDLAGLGDRIRGAVGADGYGGGQRQVYVPGGAAAGPYETRAAEADSGPRAFNSSGHAYGGGGGDTRGAISAIRGRILGNISGSGGSSYGGSSYGGSSYSAHAPSSSYEPPPIDPVLNAASHIGSMQALMAVGLERLPSETQEKYTALGNILLAKWGQKALKNPEKANKKAPHVTKKLMR